MLKSLYNYAHDHNLTIPDGYVKKTVKAYISLSSSDPTYVEIRLNDNEAVPCPDVGSLAQGGNKSNVIVEKRLIVIPDEMSAKSDFYKQSLISCSEAVPEIKYCVAALENDEVINSIKAKLDANKIRATDIISFTVDGKPIFTMEGVYEWWQEYRKTLSKENIAKVPCLITGELANPVKTLFPLNGFKGEFDNSANGSKLICFDKNAFCSYGLTQGANAPMSEYAVSAVNAALDSLLENSPKPIAGMKFVHWYDKDMPKEKDPIFSSEVLLFGGSEKIREDEDESNEVSEQEEKDAVKSANSVVDSVLAGGKEPWLNANYHILLLSIVKTRVMIRHYEKGKYVELQKNINMWENDLSLIDSRGTGFIKSKKLVMRLESLLKYQRNDKQIFKRLNDELPGVMPAILNAVLKGSELPDTVAVRALAYIRSKLFSDEQVKSLDETACQWLKVWLIRKERKEGVVTMNTYNPEHPSTAYHCGAMMAVYAAIQSAGYEDVNVNVVQRYYASAIQLPALVFGRLSQLSVHHLEKIDNNWLADYYKSLLAWCSVAVGDKIPTTLTLSEQSYFAIGYYQMQARMAKEKSERIAAAKEKKENSINKVEE